MLNSTDNIPVSFKTTPVKQIFLHGIHAFGLQQVRNLVKILLDTKREASKVNSFIESNRLFTYSINGGHFMKSFHLSNRKTISCLHNVI